MKTPFERSYWVVPGKFLAGYYPGDLDKDMMSYKLNGLLSAGILILSFWVKSQE
jgi:hypothetical protein